MTEGRPPADARQTFVGRESELAKLRTGVAAARRSGRGCLLLVRGEAGIGKTRLTEELCRQSLGPGDRVYWGRCIEGAGAPAFWPWMQILRAMVAERDGRHFAAVAANELAAVARLVPELRTGHADLPEDLLGGGEAAASTSLQGETERFRLFDGIAGFLRRIAVRTPFGLVLDDVHAADPPSLLLLEFVARQLDTLPIWIIGTYREIEAHTDAQRGALISQIARLAQPMTLAGLSQSEVGRLIENAIGKAPAARLLVKICDLTEGNPFFVDEVARLLWAGSGADDAATIRALPLTAEVRDTVRQRLRPLGQDCLGVLETAAVIGREVSFALLREAFEIGSTRLLDLLAEAAALRVLEPRSAQRYAFGHALIRETLYDDLVASARLDLHRRVGEAIERLYPASLEEHLAELAYHFTRVAPASDADKALDYAERAAQRASSMLAYEDAVSLYELALDTLPLLADETASAKQIDLLLALGDAYVRAGDTPSARGTFERAADAARARRDVDRLARAALGFGGLGLGVPSGTVDGALVALLESALAAAPGSYPPATRARLLARLALELYFSDAAARRQQLMHEAWTLAAEADANTRAYLMHARLVGLWDLTPPAERLQWSNDLIALGRDIGDDDLTMRGHGYRLLEIIDTGIAEAWEPELDALTRLAERLREPRFLGMLEGTRAMRSVWLGRFDDAKALGQKALEIVQPVRDTHTLAGVTAQTFFMQRLQGASDEAELYARAAVAAAPDIPGARCMLILALCDRGRFDEARAELDTLGDSDFDILRRANRIASLVPWLTEASWLLHDTARMQSLYRDLLPLSGRNISLQARLCFGPAAFYLGMIAAGLGRAPEALGHFEAAHELAARTGGRPLVAMIQIEQARALLSTGAVAEAHELLRAARETARNLGLHGLTKKIAALEAEPERQETKVEEIAAAVSHVAGSRARVVAFPKRPALRPAESDARKEGAAHQTPAPPASEATEPTARGPRTATLRREGALWTIAADGTVLRCKSSKGIEYLVHLLRHPGKSFHVMELLALAEGSPATEHELQRLNRPQLDELGLHIGPPQVGEPIADAKALAAYRSRLEDLNSELAEATRFNDLERGRRLQEEVDTLTQALADAIGLGSRARATGSFTERARLNVTRAIRSAIQRISDGHPGIGQHLSRTVRTGTFCGYAPEPTDAMRWEL